ncbi:TetR/AcrR family transcriptional regulator [Arthrobacter sp. NPDC090010]|uniref:TetR/AcrR family transcriptional regulator n=1 Tax=Arthrobacter sp. NPDC090010 TaxID=3363942 RepID=UPI00382C2689
MAEAAPGRRERKKAATRRAIADAALEMFLDRGFDAVTIKEVAERADVSLATVYAHFPQKEALVYDEDDEMRDALLAAVREREPGTTISSAIHHWLRTVMDEYHEHEAQAADFNAMVFSAPSLREYERSMWLRHETALVDAIAEDLGQPATHPFIRVFAHYALETWAFLDRTDDPDASLEATFALLEPGWAAFERSVVTGD